MSQVSASWQLSLCPVNRTITLCRTLWALQEFAMVYDRNITLARFAGALPVFPALYRIIIALRCPGFPLATVVMLLPTWRNRSCRQGCTQPWGSWPLPSALCWAEDWVYLPWFLPFRSPFRLLPATIPSALDFHFPQRRQTRVKAKHAAASLLWVLLLLPCSPCSHAFLPT